MSQQQTVLRVQTNIPHLSISGTTQFTNLDLYSDIPIKINKSIADIQDIGKRNSDYSIGLSIPGSKKNNRFFESFFNVDSQSLYFNATSRVNCDVLLNGESYFRGYMRLNKVSVINSKVEYDVTLYSTVGDLFGKIGNNLLQDLDFDDSVYTFNHTFNLNNVGNSFTQFNFFENSQKTIPYFYPIVHNGYNYETISGNTLPNITGATISEQTRLYTSTSPISGWTTQSGATAAGVKDGYINSDFGNGGLRDNQLKPALSIWSLIKLIFKTYGYSLSGNFFNTPYMKGLYMYGYFSSEGTKFGYKLNNIETLPIEGIELVLSGNSTNTGTAIVCKRGTGVPCYCSSDVQLTFVFNPVPIFFQTRTIPAGISGTSVTVSGRTFSESQTISANVSQPFPIKTNSNLRFPPTAIGSSVNYVDGDTIDFSLVIDQNIKQIDLLSSIAKKFNLVFIQNPDNPKDIIVEPFDFYMGTGTIYDWTPKISWDKGFTVEPALNYIESTLELTDQEDGDEGNRIFKNQNNRVYGRNLVYNPTDFKSQDKKIDTIFSPELIRVWDNNINLPLGINYSASNEQNENTNQIVWLYKGVKSKPKLFYWMGANNPFIDKSNEVFPYFSSGVNTYTVKLQASSVFSGTIDEYSKIPTISHTMPLGGLSDEDRVLSGFSNDKICILFNSEQPVDIGVQTFNTYTENDVYNLFYENRISNIYNPNTRYLSGYFDLKYSDVQNLKWNDIIKINEQYFYINKISEFNLTNRELTKVELVQFDVSPKTYPTRYFKYQYCDQTGYSFSFKTDFTNSNLRNTNQAFALYYDLQLGSLSGTTTGFTSVFKYFDTTAFEEKYVPYTMQEITKTEYETGGYYDWIFDTLKTEQFNNDSTFYLFPPFWENSGLTFTGACVWINCSSFTSAATTYGIRVGSSTYYGAPTIPTPTPTITNTPTPSPTPGGATSTPTPTPSPTPIPTGSVPTGSLFYYDPGNISSYPGSGSVLYDLSGNGRHANINTGITWVSGSDAYFNLNGNDNNSITGTTLSQTLTSWSMWMGIYRNDIGTFDGYMTERTAAGNINGLGQYFNGNNLNLLVNNGTQIGITNGSLITGSWLFIAGAVDNTTFNTQVYKSGSLNPFESGSKAAGSSNFNDPIVLGEDKESGQDRTMNGRIGPALMYDRKLSTSELTGINDYFKTRYGI